jgi:hypothetical protein
MTMRPLSHLYPYDVCAVEQEMVLARRHEVIQSQLRSERNRTAANHGKPNTELIATLRNQSRLISHSARQIRDLKRERKAIQSELQSEEKRAAKNTELIEKLKNDMLSIENQSCVNSTVGVALSGGGIRSATFCLGVFQGLASYGLVRKIDFLSTVSGGGYFGGFLGRLYTRTWACGRGARQPYAAITSFLRFVTATARSFLVSARDRFMKQDSPDDPPPQPRMPDDGKSQPKDDDDCKSPEEPPINCPGLEKLGVGAERVEKILVCPKSSPMDWLRENGRYLSPRGFGDTLFNITVVLRNLGSLAVVMGLLPLLLFSLFDLERSLLCSWPCWLQWEQKFVPAPGSRNLWWSPWLVLPELTFVWGAVPLTWAYWLTQSNLFGKKNDEPKIPLCLATLLLGVAARYAALHGIINNLAGWIVAISASLTLVIWLGVQIATRRRGLPPDASIQWARNMLSRGLKTALLATGWLLVFVVLDSVGQTVYAVAAVLKWQWVSAGKIVAGLSGAATLLLAARKLALSLDKLPKTKPFPVSLNIIALVVALAISLVLALMVAVMTDGIAWNWSTPRMCFKTALHSPGYNLVVPANRYGVALSPEKYVTVIENDTPQDGNPTSMATPKLEYVAVICLGLAWVIGTTRPFLNLSSLQQTYRSRIVRAFLGASNPNRWSGIGRYLTEVIGCDDTRLRNYKPHKTGGPLHIVNVTLNETVSGKTNIEFRDRKGLSMAVGPAAITVGSKFHATWVKAGDPTQPQQIKAVDFNPAVFHALAGDRDHRQHKVEDMTIGQWLAISGAAFATGLGFGTSLGKSMVLALANVRLGYWWDSYIKQRKLNQTDPQKPEPSGMDIVDKYPWLNHRFPVQTNLVNEFLGRFHGPNRQLWYLSDGGHFENTGAYELLRRRVPFIIVCDAGCDSNYQFEDLASLVRMARTDFGAEVDFFDSKDPPPLDVKPIQLNLASCLQPVIGGLEQFAIPPAPAKDGNPPLNRTKSHALLARVTFPADQPGQPGDISWLMILKPSLTGDEPLDILQYQAANPNFPQESTIEQYFNEAQWESYRKLGEHIALEVFKPCFDPAAWYPALMAAPA